MSVVRSAELEAVMTRFLSEYMTQGLEVIENLLSSDPIVRVLGFDADEFWEGRDEFLAVRHAQITESPAFRTKIHRVEAFTEGTMGWATMFFTIEGADVRADMRSTGVFRLESGVWRVVQWHNSIPVSNQLVFGTDLTTTLSALVDSVMDDQGIALQAEMSEGTVTLVFTDIVDSTPLAEAVGDAEWSKLIAAHEATIRGITGANGGAVVKMLGDGSMLAFDSARSAVRAALSIQEVSLDQPFELRIGVHTGEVTRTQDDLFGTTVNKAARIASATTDGTVTASSTTRDLIGSMPGIRVSEPRSIGLKGLLGTHQVVTVEAAP